MGRGGNQQLNGTAPRPTTKKPTKAPHLVHSPLQKNWNDDYGKHILEAYDSLSNNQMLALNTHLRPRGSSSNGFMAKDQALLEIVERDTQALADLELTPQQVGTRLFEVIQPFLKPNWNKRDELLERNSVPEHLIINGGADFIGGWQGCPFADHNLCHCANRRNDQAINMNYGAGVDSLLGKHNFKLHNKNNGVKVKASGLVTHLAADHNFFEGNVEHRTDPVLLARVLDLA